MTATVDTIADAVKDALTAQAFASAATVEVMSRPLFDRTTAAASLLVKIAGYDLLNVNRFDRGLVVEDQVIGIGIYKTLARDITGNIDETGFRSMKDFAEKVRRWGWTALSDYVATMSKPANDALYDAPSADKGFFFTVINITYRTDFEL